MTLVHVDTYNGTDVEKIQSALDDPSSSVIQMNPRRYQIDRTIEMPEGKMLLGHGMDQTTIQQLDKTKRIINKETAYSHVTMKGFEVTHEAAPEDYHPGGSGGPGADAYGIINGTGAGNNQTGHNIRVEDVRVRDIVLVGLANYGGGINHAYINCEAIRCGRGAINMQGCQQSRISGCTVIDSGDDGIAVHSDGTSVSVTGNTIRGAATIGTLNASGIKLSGSGGVVVDGNTISECANAISTNSMPGAYGDDMPMNGVGFAQSIIISNNIIFDLKYTMANPPRLPRGIEIKQCNSAVITGNIIQAIETGGLPSVPLYISNTMMLRSSGNIYSGSGILREVYAGDLRFSEDTFINFTDGPFVDFMQSSKTRRMAFDKCSIYNTGPASSRGQYTTVDEFLITDQQPVAEYCLAPVLGAITMGDQLTEIPLQSEARPGFPVTSYMGPIANLKAGTRLILTDRLMRAQRVALSQDCNRGDSVMHVEEFTAETDYTERGTWIRPIATVLDQCGGTVC